MGKNDSKFNLTCSLTLSTWGSDSPLRTGCAAAIGRWKEGSILALPECCDSETIWERLCSVKSFLRPIGKISQVRCQRILEGMETV